MNKKGVTTVELVVSFALTMTIAVLLFQVVLNLKNLYVNSGTKTQLLNKQAVIMDKINGTFIDKKIYSFSDCGENCLSFIYMDGTTGNLIVNTNEKYIEFNDDRHYLLDNCEFGSILMDSYHTPVHQISAHNDSLLMIDIPVYYNKGKQDYGIHIVHQYNSTGIHIGVPDNEKPIIGSENLATTLMKQYDEANTVGLLKDDTGYYFKGNNKEVANNFVWFAGHLWRVISIDNDNNLTMITQQPLTSIGAASEAWNTQEKYEASYIRDWLNNVFLNSIQETDKAKILNSTFNIGLYNNVTELQITQMVGLLDESQYIKAGNQNSFLDIKDVFWLGNRQDDSFLRQTTGTGGLYGSSTTGSMGVRPVIKISALNVTTGTGTLSNPYREKRQITSINDVKVGEYISIPTSGTACGEDKSCLFKVVSKDDNSIKVTLNGLLPSKSAFDVNKNATYTSGNAIDTVVTSFANTIDSKYRYTGNDKSFGIGSLNIYSNGVDYKIAQDPKYIGNVGLPVFGEMFSGNDIDLGAEKNFVDSTLIENSTVSEYYWTMNGSTSTSTWRVNNFGTMNNNSSADEYGVRPVLILNNNLTFKRGEGTAENPFILK